MTNYIDKDENEKNFQEALTNNNSEGMWTSVFITCQNICKSILSKRGVIVSEDELYDLTMDSTMMVMRNILERGVKPEKLSSYCYLRVLAHCNGYGQDKTLNKLKKAISSNALSNNTFSNSIDYDNFIDNEEI